MKTKHTNHNQQNNYIDTSCITVGDPSQNRLLSGMIESLQKTFLRLMILAFILTGFLTSADVSADEAHSQYASSSEMSTAKDVQKYGMTPISGDYIKDGTWEIDVTSSSSFFRIHSCELIAEEGEMTARLTMETSSYSLLYMGNAEEAAGAAASDYIAYEEIDDWYIFTVPVEGLNTAIDCAAFSKRKEKWYDRRILFDASSLTEEALNGLELPDYERIEDALEAYESNKVNSSDSSDAEREESESSAGQSDSSAPGTGTVSSDGAGSSAPGAGTVSPDGAGSSEVDYSEPAQVSLSDGRYSINVALTGGSGRASVSTPTLMIVEDGKAYAELLWSSTHYDWMQVGGVTYENEAEEGANSVFTIPIASFDSVIPVVADTTAMGDPVAINYTLTFYEESIGDEGLIPQVAAKKVVIFALIIIVGGFFLNLYVKKRQRI